MSFFEEYTQVFPDQKVFLNFTLETTVMLAFGIAGALILQWFLRTGVKTFVPHIARDALRKQPLIQRQFDKTFILAAIVYVVSNGLFACAIRVGT